MSKKKKDVEAFEEDRKQNWDTQDEHLRHASQFCASKIDYLVADDAGAPEKETLDQIETDFKALCKALQQHYDLFTNPALDDNTESFAYLLRCLRKVFQFDTSIFSRFLCVVARV